MTDVAALDDRDNNLIAAGAVLMLLMLTPRGTVLQTVDVVVDEQGNATNQIDIGMSFVRSTYRLTVERVDDDGNTINQREVG